MTFVLDHSYRSGTEASRSAMNWVRRVALYVIRLQGRSGADNATRVSSRLLTGDEPIRS